VNSADTVAPSNQPQSELTLRQVRDMLKSDQVPDELLKETGMSKEELNQFVKKFEKAPKAEPGEGREIEAKPGKPQAVDPNLKTTDLNPSTRVNSSTLREGRTVTEDSLRGNNEGARFVPPAEIRARYEAYRKSLARPSGRRGAASPAGGATGNEGSGGR
jgi:hypothetical protein